MPVVCPFSFPRLPLIELHSPEPSTNAQSARAPVFLSAQKKCKSSINFNQPHAPMPVCPSASLCYNSCHPKEGNTMQQEAIRLTSLSHCAG